MLKSNEYFEGKVKSIALETKKGPATIGVMEKGEYEFTTDGKEIMTVLQGKMKVLLPGKEKYKTIMKDKSFQVYPNSTFKVQIEEDAAYICYYE